MDFEQSQERLGAPSVNDRTLSETVVHAVAEAEGADPKDLGPLHDVVNTDALDALFRGRTGGTVMFEYHDYRVQATSSGEVTLGDSFSAVSRNTVARDDVSTTRYPFDACAHCGTRFELGVTYPVERREEPDGEFQLYSFCNDECQDAWNAED